MLVEFQQAMADLTASPELCNAVRSDPGVLAAHYQLSERETRRLLAIVRHPGMAAACSLYRMNRLAPMALNIRATLRAMGPALGPMLDDYWRDHPRGHAHFYVETDRFCRWLRARIDAGHPVPPELPAVLDREAAAVRASLADSRADTADAADPGDPGDAGDPDHADAIDRADDLRGDDLRAEHLDSRQSPTPP